MKISSLAQKNLMLATLIFSIAGFAFSPVAQASPLVTQTFSTTDISSGEAYSAYIPSTGNNLLSSATLDSSSTWNPFPPAGYQSTPFVPTGDRPTSTSYGTLTDGQGFNFSTPGTGSYPWAGSVVTMGSTGSDFTTLTYTLAVTQGGHDITTIDLFTGWGDGGRINPVVNIFYSTDGTTFVSLADINNDGLGYGHEATYTHLDITGLSGVTALQFQFANQQNGYAGYAELAAGGPTPVPETSSWGFLLAVVGCLIVLKRLKRQAT